MVNLWWKWASIDFFLICAFFSTYRNHSLDIESSTIQDAGDYTFVPEGYTHTLSAKVHIIGMEKLSLMLIIFMLKHSLKECPLDQLCRSSQGAFRGTECPGQHGDHCGWKQTPPGDPC